MDATIIFTSIPFNYVFGLGKVSVLNVDADSAIVRLLKPPYVPHFYGYHFSLRLMREL